MKEIYEQLGISREVYEFGAEIESALKERFEEFDRKAEYNQMKVLLAMQKNKVSSECFNGSSGYGYDDFGRDTLEKVYADTFQQRPVWYVLRLPAELTLLPLHFLEISVRETSFWRLPENHMIHWKK